MHLGAPAAGQNCQHWGIGRQAQLGTGRCAVWLHRDDGGFSFEAAGSITNHNRHDVTRGQRQSDLVGTVFFLETLLRQCRVLGLPVAWAPSVTHGVRLG